MTDSKPDISGQDRIVPLSPQSGSETRATHVLVDQESHSGAGPEETSGAEPGRLVVALLLNERPILGHIVESLENRLERDLILPGEFFGSERIRTMDGFVDHRRSDSSTLEE